MSKNNPKAIWQDRKRPFFTLPWSFTRYVLEADRLIIDTGFLSRNEDEIKLYRIMDITLKRTLWQRILGLGTIHCCSGDKTSPEFDIKRIKHPKEVRDKLSELVESERERRRIGVREMMGDDDAFDDNGPDEHNDD